jgi:hypothetical protein
MPRLQGDAALSGGAGLTKRKRTNLAASVHQLLMNKASQTHRPFNELLQYYAMERFLYRLSRSPYAGKFILKGALMFTAWRLESYRPTVDIDLLGKAGHQVDNIVEITKSICSLPVEPDGLIFNSESVTGARIAEDADYEGVRTRFRANLDTARITLQLDIGFGDVTFPLPKRSITQPFSIFQHHDCAATAKRPSLPKNSNPWSSSALLTAE